MSERFRIEHGAIPEPVRRVCATLHGAGHGAWIVGGCVRDLLLGRTVSDWDVCTSARPEQVSALFRKVIPTGIAHGTVTVVVDRVHYEVTTLRGEGAYTDGRRPDSVFFVDEVRDDLARRDFTVNAIAYDVVRDEFIDPFDGRADLTARRVRAVGDGNERFREDGLRVLRAARFCATLEFALDPATRDAIRPNLATFRRVSLERVRDEWLKTMKARAPSRAFLVMHETGILEAVCPELALFASMTGPAPYATAFDHALATMDAIAGGDAILRLAGLLHPLGGARCRAFARRTKFSNDEADRLEAVADAMASLPPPETPAPTLRRWLRRVTPERFRDLSAVARAARVGVLDAGAREGLERTLTAVEDIVRRGDPLDARALAVNGADLQRELAMAPGRGLGIMLQRLLDAVLDDPAANTRERLLSIARVHAEREG
jgi:tRNA nucleotidyltransferase (CCA-adding enzyme)